MSISSGWKSSVMWDGMLKPLRMYVPSGMTNNLS
jgi:hypothetical protein